MQLKGIQDFQLEVIKAYNNAIYFLCTFAFY